MDYATTDDRTLARIARLAHTGDGARAEIARRAHAAATQTKAAIVPPAGRHVLIHSGNVDLSAYTLIPKPEMPGSRPREPWLRWKRAY